MSKLMSKQDRKYAELATEWMLIEVFGCKHTRRALRTKFAKVDFWASDVMGMNIQGEKFFVQATAGQDSAVSQRRTKLSKYSWHFTDRVMVAVLRKKKVGRSNEYYFILHQFDPIGLGWENSIKQIPVKREWFKAYKI